MEPTRQDENNIGAGKLLAVMSVSTYLVTRHFLANFAKTSFRTFETTDPPLDGDHLFTT